ncbi:MAG: copper amine oxidase N-terminal domain-containing protein [Candidatus Eremiobacteraeota bacterium]|nr:copper amine oxidase N-terminal domain-containing protein [Candidatus Eremiobacteraeota bacterium]
MLQLKRSAALGLMLAFFAGFGTMTPASAQSAVTINVNGQTVTFDQPPIERAGRVYVPLRGVFERLGASVVYQNGVINAQGNGRSVSLRIGQQTATVNGQSVGMDVAPFMVGARTMVPLRFVAQALGATVNYDFNAHTVYIVGAGGSTSNQPTPNLSFRLDNVRPQGNVNTLTPAIHATFSEPVNRDSMRVYIDGNDVTNSVYANANGFDVTPPTPLRAGTHHVRVTGTTQAGASFDRGWNFTTVAGASTNFIRDLTPAAGTNVSGGSFTMSGDTLPNSRVHIVAGGQANVGGLFQVGTGTFTTDVTADSSGRFTAPISVTSVPGGNVRVIIQSTSPDGSSIERSVVYGS